MAIRGVFLKTLADHGRLLRVWTLGMAVGAVALILLAARAVLPGWLVTIFSGPALAPSSSAAVASVVGGLSGPAAWLDTLGLSLLVPLALAGFAIEMGCRLLAGQDQDGELELLLAYPLQRGLLALEKLAALAVSVAALAGVTGLLLWAGFGALAGLTPDAGQLAARLGEGTLLALGFGGLALAVSARNGRRWPAREAGLGGLALALLTAFAWRVSPTWLGWTRYLSPLSWAISGWALPLAAFAVLMGGLALAGFEQREVLG